MENKTLTQEQVKSILDKAPSNLNRVKILQGLVQRGYTLQGFQAPSQTTEQPNYFQRVGQDFSQGFQRAKEEATATDDRSALSKGLSATASGFGALVSPIAELPVIKQVGELFGKGIELAGKIPIPYSEAFKQKLASMSDEEFNKMVQPLEDLKNLGEISNSILLAKGGQEGARGLKTAGGKVLEKGKVLLDKTGKMGTKAGQAIKNVTSEIVPKAENFVNEEISKALDLSPGDITRIESSTGNVVGRFLADENLIGKNKAETVKSVDKYFEDNYKTVRSEIAKVDKTYKQYNVPRYVEALKEIKKQVDDVPGLQKVAVEVENLLNKKEIELLDVQKVKELMDEHFKLYRVTGDVKEGVAKQGLANVRQDLKKFIEKEVKDTTGADIADLNNKVSTAKSISDTIAQRSSKGLTKSHIKIGDLGIFGLGAGLGSPLVGAALLVAKKIIESPAMRLKIARVMDKFTDAKRLKIKRELEAGKAPKEITDIIK